MQKNKQYYDEFYQNTSVDIHDNVDRFVLISKLLYGKVLDVACGTGTLSNYYDGQYVGVDVSDIAIKKAKEARRSGVRFLQADFTKDAFAIEQKFDCAYLGEFLEHIENDEIVFNNLLDVVVSNGRIVVSVPNGDRVPDESHCRIFTVPQIRRDYSKYGKVQFHNWVGFRDRIVFSIELGKADPNLLTLCMTVKDEEKGLENAILSCLEIVDHVVVSVDSKTTDNTRKIAKLYADEVKIHTWEGSFSKARNFAHQGITSKYILFLDGHEFLESAGDVRALLNQYADGIMCTIKMETGATFQFPRIYANGLQFEKDIHNELKCEVMLYCPNFVIVHDRNNAQSKASIKARTEQRNSMLPKIMTEELRKNPKDQRALFYLANFYMTAMDFKKAMAFYKKCFKVTPSLDEKFFILANIGICHQLLGNKYRALWTFIRLDDLQSNRFEAKRLLGGAYILLEDYKSALPILIDALEPNKQCHMYELFAHNLSELWDLIGTCFSHLNQPVESVMAWERAQETCQDPQRKAFFATKVKFAKMLIDNPNATLEELPKI